MKIDPLAKTMSQNHHPHAATLGRTIGHTQPNPIGALLAALADGEEDLDEEVEGLEGVEGLERMDLAEVEEWMEEWTGVDLVMGVEVALA